MEVLGADLKNGLLLIDLPAGAANGSSKRSASETD
jgi:hypothetical protein